MAFERQREYRVCPGWKGYTTAFLLLLQMFKSEGHWDNQKPLWKDELTSLSSWNNISTVSAHFVLILMDHEIKGQLAYLPCVFRLILVDEVH